MAQNVFNPETNYTIPLVGHRFDGYMGGPCTVHGYFAADTVEVSGEAGGEREYAVFTVDEPVNGEYPHAFVGTYRISMGNVKQSFPWVLPQPEPEPEPQPEPDPDPEPNPDDPAEEPKE